MENEQARIAFSQLSDRQLYGMYRPAAWGGLRPAERLELLQETVNREGCCQTNVSFAPMEPNISGFEKGGEIVLNEEMVVRDQMTCRFDGQAVTYRPPDIGYRMLETVLHEHRHAVQEKIILGQIPVDCATRARLAANDTTFSLFDGRVVSQYLKGETEAALYYLQPCELDAYRTSQDRTVEILRDIQSQYGPDSAMEAYTQRLEDEGWQAQVDRANAAYQCLDVPEEIAKALLHVYTNGAEPAAKAGVGRAVWAEMVVSAEQGYAAAALWEPVVGEETNQRRTLALST